LFDRNTYANHENTAITDKKKKFAATPNTVESIGQLNIKYLQCTFTVSCPKSLHNDYKDKNKTDKKTDGTTNFAHILTQIFVYVTRYGLSRQYSITRINAIWYAPTDHSHRSGSKQGWYINKCWQMQDHGAMASRFHF